MGPGNKHSGIAIHPAHLHVTPYQITKLLCTNGTWIGPDTQPFCSSDVSASPCNQFEAYFQVGDWHDTLAYSGGQAVVKMQTSNFTGPYVLHCHILSHEDFGMMGYFNVTGEEGTLWPHAKTQDPTCYYDYVGAGWTPIA